MRVLRRLMGVGLLLAVLLVALLPIRTHASAQDFAIRSFDADYYLTRDVDKRSDMRVVERLVAEFPPYDQNHGIERAIPQEYDGHKVSLEVTSVKNDKGKAWPFTTYESRGNTVLRVGDPDKFVRNLQTYVIEYQLRDVTKDFGDHHELYWDVNGTDWGQPFGSVTARVHMKGDVAKAYQGRFRCIEGAKGSTNGCQASETKNGDETVLIFQASRMLYAGENMTLVTAFDDNTFAGYQPTTWERIFPWLVAMWLLSGVVVLIVVIVMLSRAWHRYGKSPDGKGTIIPEYLPPKDISVLTASVILKKDGKDETAQLIDLAVRHYLKIYETETKGSWFRHKKSYELELVHSLTGLRNEEKKLLELIFGANPEVGSRVTIEAIKSKLYTAAAKLQKDTTEAQALVDGYLADMSHARKHYYWIGAMLLLAGTVLLNPGVFISGVVTFIVASMFHPLTEKGVEMRDYLRGLEMYMKLAEAERLRVLQSPSGALKTPVNTRSKKQLVKVYERLLPYAIIFGMEKEWAEAFAPLYTQPPDWYVGNWGTFHAATFVGSLNSFTATTGSTFSPPSNSSSSGFSGGGSSGGGGGGGGGGGW
jgi:uncharacterized membrane protein YgcG